MKSAPSGTSSDTAADEPRLELPVTVEDSRALEALRYAHPLPFADYLEFLTAWTERWFPGVERREGPVAFDRPFELRDGHSSR